MLHMASIGDVVPSDDQRSRDERSPEDGRLRPI